MTLFSEVVQRNSDNFQLVVLFRQIVSEIGDMIELGLEAAV